MKDAGLEGLATARLQLRRFTPGDLDFLFRLYDDEEVSRYTGGRKTREQCQETLQKAVLDYYGSHPGLGIWITQERSSGEPIGMHLLNHMRGESHIQVGYSLMKPWWGQGYATEMCRALLRYGFADLGLPRIHAITALPNTASQHVLLKSGLLRQGERIVPAYSTTDAQAWFERDAADWLAV